MEQNQYQRQLDWFDPEKHNIPVTVIGAGGIGGPTTLALAKLGVRKIKVYDFDKVEKHNQPNQVYGLHEVGAEKVHALGRLLWATQGPDFQIEPRATRFTKRNVPNGIVIGAVDSMDARRAIWSAVQAAGPRVPLYIDGRIGGEVIRVLTVQPSKRGSVRQYTNTLVANHAVAPLKCTAAGIIDVSFVVASLIVRALRLFVTKQEIISDLFYDHRNLTFLKR